MSKRKAPEHKVPDQCGTCGRPHGPCYNKDQRHPAAGIFQDDVEPGIATGLVRHGCDVEQKARADRDFKIDALVTAIDAWSHEFLPVGLQITAGLDREDKIESFRNEAVKWPGIGSLIYVEIVGAVSHKMIKAVKAAIIDLIDQVEKGRKRDPKPLVKRIRFYEDGNRIELPLGQN